jgi:hypothetical protein
MKEVNKSQYNYLFSISGMFWGYIYFVLSPILLFSAFGSIPAFDLDVDDFDSITLDFFTYIGFTFLSLIVVRKLTICISKTMQSNKNQRISSNKLANYVKACWMALFWIYIVHSSNSAASHWSEGSAGALGTGGGIFFTLLLNISNIVLLASPFVCLSTISRDKLALYSTQIFFINLVAVILTGNRIFALGPLLMLIIFVNWRVKLLMIPFIPIIFFASHVYSVLRSKLVVSNIDFSILYPSLLDAIEYRLDTFSFIDVLSPVFESANVVVLSYIVNTGYVKNIGFLETIFFRPVSGILGIGETGKIKSISLYVGKEIGLDGVAINSTLLGEAWLNGGGFPWMLILLFCGLTDILAVLLKFSTISRVVLFSCAFFAWRFEFMYLFIGFSLVAFYEVLIWPLISMKMAKKLNRS